MASSSTSTTLSSPSSSSAGLCPGYRHVEEFVPDEEYEDEVEECYVTLDLGAAEPTLIPSSSTYRLIGLDTPTPFMQLSGTVLQGRHESLLGTELLFTEAKDAQDRSKRRLSFTSITEQRIRFKEVQLRPKVASGAGDRSQPTEDNQVQTQEGSNKNSPVTSSQMAGKDFGTAPRRKSKKSNDKDSTSRSTGNVPRRRKSTKKDKGKAKEVEEEEGQVDDNADCGASMDIDSGS
ncbi:hypothetical protein J3R30DRAFT_91929 [Lentinula aciculospora]|uniref:Transcription factor TFIIIC triple barrel domain-containing protein n=1 Tax=Lentinula aciculospora TaxID=153920 RepID=A0A9W9DXY9_9AGAR|nr:hypothetical protein J3R30DRAFT_91929 [Lentinula aciculospora]